MTSAQRHWKRRSRRPPRCLLFSARKAAPRMHGGAPKKGGAETVLPMNERASDASLQKLLGVDDVGGKADPGTAAVPTSEDATIALQVMQPASATVAVEDVEPPMVVVTSGTGVTPAACAMGIRRAEDDLGSSAEASSADPAEAAAIPNVDSGARCASPRRIPIARSRRVARGRCGRAPCTLR